MHFFHCRSSQGQYIRRHDHIRDALLDHLAQAVRPTDCYAISAECEPLVRKSLPTTSELLSSSSSDTEAREIDAPSASAEDEVAYAEEARCPYHPMMTLADRRHRDAADKTAGQCRGDIGLWVDSSYTLVDVAIGDATARTYRRPPLPLPAPAPPPSTTTDPALDPGPKLATDGHAQPPRRGRYRGGHPSPPLTNNPSPFVPHLPGQSFALEHRAREKKSKFRHFLGVDAVEDPRRFVPFVLEASGRLGSDAKAFLEYLRTICSFPILRFRALVSVISAKHNAQMALGWVRYLRHPVKVVGDIRKTLLRMFYFM